MTTATKTANTDDETFDVEFAPDAIDKLNDFLMDPSVMLVDSFDELKEFDISEMKQINWLKRLLQILYTPKDYNRLLAYMKKKYKKNGVFSEMFEYTMGKLNAAGESDSES